MICYNITLCQYEYAIRKKLSGNPPIFRGDYLAQHPFERMLIEVGVKHRYTKPYRPQTNGKAERFWRTLKDDLLEGTEFESLEHLREELVKYLIYYNEIRPHQALAGKTPLATLNLSTN